MARENDLANPSCATVTTGYTGDGALTRLTGLSGGGLPRTTGLSMPAAAGAFTSYIDTSGMLVTAAAGQTWTAVLWIRYNVARSVLLSVTEYNSGTWVADFGNATTALGANTWTQCRVTAASLAGTFNQVAVSVNFPGAGTAGTVSISSGRLERIDDSTMEFADGGSPGWSWDGAVGNSQSTQNMPSRFPFRPPARRIRASLR